MLSVALPTLAAALRASESDLQWFSFGYALTLAAGMLHAGVQGDRFGRKRVMLGALVLFVAGSIACAYAPGPGAFIAARIVLGAAGAALVVMAMSVVTVLFSEERPRVVGIWAAANFLALPIGPILAGWLLTNYCWGFVFLMNDQSRVHCGRRPRWHRPSSVYASARSSPPKCPPCGSARDHPSPSPRARSGVTDRCMVSVLRGPWADGPSALSATMSRSHNR